MNRTKSFGSRAVAVAAVLVGFAGLSTEGAVAAPAMRLTVDDAVVIEGDVGTSSMVFTVHVSKEHPNAITIPWSVAGATATAPADFTGATGTVVVPARSTSATVTVSVKADRVDEADETLQLRLGTPSAGRVEDGSAVGTIVDDDADRTLTVSASDGGSVTGEPGGVACGSAGTTCTATLMEGTPVTLTATPDADHRLVGWGGACASEGAAPTCTVVLDADATVEATFELAVAFVTVRIPDPSHWVGDSSGAIACGGGGTPPGIACFGAFPLGTVDTFTVAVSPGEEFTGWTDDCAFAGTSLTCTLTLNRSMEIGVSFVSRPAVIVTASAGGVVQDDDEQIDCTNNGLECVGYYDLGQVVTLTATPVAGTAFGGWGGACSGMSLTCTLTLSERITSEVTATFVYALEVVHAPRYGAISAPGAVGSPLLCGRPNLLEPAATGCASSFTAGTVVVLQAAPSAPLIPGAPVGTFVAWAGACAGSNPECYVAMDGPAAVCAVFQSATGEQDTACVELPHASMRGLVTSAPAGIACGSEELMPRAMCVAGFDPGTPLTLTATPRTDISTSWLFIDYTFVRWEGACAGHDETCSLPSAAVRGILRTCAIFHEDSYVDGQGLGPSSENHYDDPSCGL